MTPPDARPRPAALRPDPRPTPGARAGLLAGAGLVLGLLGASPADAAVAPHGGAYRGPGNTVPGGGAAPGGAPAGLGDTVPPNGDAPRPPTPNGGKPLPPGTCNEGSGRTPDPSGPATPTASAGTDDPTDWTRWWLFNQAAYVDVRAAVHGSDLELGTDDFFLGHVPEAFARERLRPDPDDLARRVDPALRRVLAEETDHHLVTGALVALAKLGDHRDRPPVLPVLRGFLGDSNQEIAETAAVSLGILGSADAMPLLIALLHDEPAGRRAVGRTNEVPWRTRAFAAYGLGVIGRRARDTGLRQMAGRALVDTLEGAARDMAAPDVAVACVSALGVLRDPADGPLGAEHAAHVRRVRCLSAVLADDARPLPVRAHATTALARAAAQLAHDDAARHAAWDQLLAVGVDSKESGGLAAGALQALGDLGDAGAGERAVATRDTLRRMARRAPDPDRRHLSLVALARVGTRPGPDAAPWAGLDDVRAELLHHLDQGRAPSRPWAALALGLLGRGLAARGVELDRELDARLLQELDDARSPREVAGVALACGLRGTPDAVPLVRRQFAEVREDEARGFVAQALGLLGDPRALGPVRDVIDEARFRPELMRQAAISLGLLGDKTLVPDLVVLLDRSGSTASRAAVATALGAIGDARSLDPLLAMLADEQLTSRARSFAAVALGLVGDKDDHPWNTPLALGVHYRAATVTLVDGQGSGILEIL